MKQLTPEQARELGIIQEVNRYFLHPLGLALGIRVDDITGVASYFIWDCSDDPEGIYFSDEIITSTTAREKAARVDALFQARRAARLDAFGYIIQPLPGDNK